MRSFGSALAILFDFADEGLRQRRQQARPVGRHHVVVGGRNRRRDADLEFDVGRDDAGLLQAVEHAPGLDRHVGIAGLERGRVGRRAGLDAQPRDFAHHLAVPLHELERRHVLGVLDRRILGEHVLQEADPGLADAGLAVRQADGMAPDRARQACGRPSRCPATECCRRNARSVACCGLRTLAPSPR